METMKVARWGNSLAVRLPSRVVKELALEEGDSVDAFMLQKTRPKLSKAEAFAALDRIAAKLPRDMKPEDWKVNRDDPDFRG